MARVCSSRSKTEFISSWTENTHTLRVSFHSIIPRLGRCLCFSIFTSEDLNTHFKMLSSSLTLRTKSNPSLPISFYCVRQNRLVLRSQVTTWRRDDWKLCVANPACRKLVEGRTLFNWIMKSIVLICETLASSSTSWLENILQVWWQLSGCSHKTLPQTFRTLSTPTVPVVQAFTPRPSELDSVCSWTDRVRPRNESPGCIFWGLQAVAGLLFCQLFKLSPRQRLIIRGWSESRASVLKNLELLKKMFYHAAHPMWYPLPRITWGVVVKEVQYVTKRKCTLQGETSGSSVRGVARLASTRFVSIFIIIYLRLSNKWVASYK